MTVVPHGGSVPVPMPEEGEDWQPQIIAPLHNNLPEWEWATRARPPYIAGTWQEHWSKVVLPLRCVALFMLWLTWHWARFAALSVVLALLVVLILVR